nr:FtsJ methyltransferase domain-containing protein 2 [Polyrhizophydium stewartii]
MSSDWPMAAAPHHDANGAQIGTHETTPAAPGAASAAPSTAAHADADAAAAATRALYDTEAYAQTELVSSIPPPSLDFLRALVERDGQHSVPGGRAGGRAGGTVSSRRPDDADRRWAGPSRVPSHPLGPPPMPSPLLPMPSPLLPMPRGPALARMHPHPHPSIQRNVPSPSPVPVLFRSDARAPHEAAVSWLVRGGGGDVAEVWRGHELVVVQPAAPVDYSQFCFADLVEQLFAAKRRLPELSKDQFAKSRDMANPHELVGKSVFLNRSAVKLASLDAQLRLVHGALARTGGSARVDFVDLCAGPGGFTEYLVWRAATHDAGAATPVVATTPPSSSSSSITATTAAAAAASPWTQVRGWGMTLRGDQDFQTDAMVVPPTGEQLTPVYGADGTGDMYNSDNIREMARVVMEATGGVGVHLVVADGGFSVAGDELYHEEHTAQLILCQIAGMFHVLRKGGTFVLKTFDLFTPLSVELVYILHLHFERIAIVKPVPSRPANSERCVNPLSRPVCTSISLCALCGS